MSTYPSVGILIGAAKEFDTGRQADRATNGAVRARVFYSARKRKFTFEHKVQDTDLATLDAFHEANLAAPFDFVWPIDGATYSCIYSRDPSERALGAGWFQLSVEIVEA